MIRINLLSEGRRPVVARSAKPKLDLGEQDKSLYILAAGLILGVLLAGGWWLKLHAERSDWQDRVRTAQREVDELKDVVEKVEEFKKKQEELATKIEVITQLTQSQSGPVHLMDEISKALPELLWLTSMSMTENEVKLQGQAFNTNAVALFIENLDSVEWFDEPEGASINAQDETFAFDLSFGYSAAKRRELENPPSAEGEGEESLAEESGADTVSDNPA